MKYISIEKGQIPYEFELVLGDSTFQFEINYNSLGDFFTVTLFKDHVRIIDSYKVVYNVPLFENLGYLDIPKIIIKPLDTNKLSNDIDCFIKDKKMFSPIVVNVYGEQIVISSEDIIYLEGSGKYCNIRTIDNTVQSSKTLAGVLKLLPQHCFFRTHKSYAINLYCIVSIKDDFITLNNGEKAKISRNRMSDFKKAYKDFIKHFNTRV